MLEDSPLLTLSSPLVTSLITALEDKALEGEKFTSVVFLFKRAGQ